MGIEEVTKIQLICGKAYSSDGHVLANHQGWYYLVSEGAMEQLLHEEPEGDYHPQKMSPGLRGLFPEVLTLDEKDYELNPDVDIIPNQAIIVRYQTLESEIDDVLDEIKQGGD